MVENSDIAEHSSDLPRRFSRRQLLKNALNPQKNSDNSPLHSEELSKIGKRPMSRRDFVKNLAIGTGLGAIASVPLGEHFFSQHQQDIQTNSESSSPVRPTEAIQYDVIHTTINDGEITVPENLRELFNSIMEYRAMIGLNSVPKELYESFQHPTEAWHYADRQFEISLPDHLKSYGMYTEDIINTTFGERAAQLVSTITVNPKEPGMTAFQPDEPREFYTGYYVSNTDILSDYNDLVLHEAIGHGSDPVFTPQPYPSDVLFKIEHGKWRMLSQAFSVDGQFFNHPNDMMRPQFQRQIGEQVALHFRHNDLSTLFSTEDSYKKVRGILENISREENIPLEHIKFNKRISRLIGQQVFDQVTTNEVQLGEDLRIQYESQVETALVEIYAEMMRMSILHPDEIGQNPEIVQGCTEILSAIQGKPVDLESIRIAIQNPRSEVVERNTFEKQLLIDINDSDPKATPDIHISTPTAEELARAKTQQEEIANQKREFTEFTAYGKIPSSVEKDTALHELLKAYAYTCSQIYTKYPDTNFVDDLFDPQLDIWDIQNISNCLNAPFINQLIQNIHEDPAEINRDDLKQKLDVIASFLISPAFGT